MRKWGLEANANRLFGWMVECEGQKHKLVRKKLSLSANSPYATREKLNPSAPATITPYQMGL